MAILRGCAWLLLLVAVILLTGDVTQAIYGNQQASASLLSHWKNVSPGTLASAGNFVQHSLHPKLWDPLLLRLMLLPAWLIAGALGFVCAILSRGKRRVNIFAN